MAKPSRKLAMKDHVLVRREVDFLVNVFPKVYEFPYPTTDSSLCEILDSCLPHSVLGPRDALIDMPAGYDILNKSTWTKLVIDNVLLNIQFKEAQSYYAYTNFGLLQLKHGITILHTINENNPYYSKLHEWAQQMRQLRSDSFVTSSLLNHCLEHCNTSGQLARAWPELAQFMPDDMAFSLRNQQCRSRLPTTLDILRVNEERHKATEFLALMALMKDVQREVRVRVS